MRFVRQECETRSCGTVCPTRIFVRHLLADSYVPEIHPNRRVRTKAITQVVLQVHGRAAIMQQRLMVLLVALIVRSQGLESLTLRHELPSEN